MNHVITADLEIEAKNVPIATTSPASQEAVDLVLGSEVGTGDGRSEWVWLRLHNGDLMLGVFPQGDTYEKVADDAADWSTS